MVAQLDHLWPVTPAPGMEDPPGGPVVRPDLLQQVAVCGAGIPRTEKGSWVSTAGRPLPPAERDRLVQLRQRGVGACFTVYV